MPGVVRSVSLRRRMPCPRPVLRWLQQDANRRQTCTEAAAERRVVDIMRLTGFLLLALAFYSIITQPHEAAAVAKNVGYALREAANSIYAFFSEIL